MSARTRLHTLIRVNYQNCHPEFHCHRGSRHSMPTGILAFHCDLGSRTQLHTTGFAATVVMCDGSLVAETMIHHETSAARQVMVYLHKAPMQSDVEKGRRERFAPHQHLLASRN